METTRIAHDLAKDGFDPKIHLDIAQEGLRHLQESLKDLPDIEAEYAEAVRGFQQSGSSIFRERMGNLAEEMKELRQEMEGAPSRIEGLKNDITMLKMLIAQAKGDGHGEGSTSQEENIVGNGRINEKRASGE
ncbi:MAG: hypothetical protein LQ338_004945 [Usnochroma carphineum]|nr:MAG: hypothetical protein LQ338_004945 [Usnochroma carphineum]